MQKCKAQINLPIYTIMWVEIDHFSTVYFDHITAFEALQCKISIKSRAHTHCVDVSGRCIHASMQCVWALPLMKFYNTVV